MTTGNLITAAPTLKEVEANLQASLPPSVVLSLREVTDAGYNLIAYSVEGTPPVEDMETALRMLDADCAPATSREVGELIAELYALTKQRNQEQISLDLAIEAYGSRLLQYPADIVREVLKTWPDRSTWWPSWHELKDGIDWRNKREKMRQALARKMDSGKSSKIASIIRTHAKAKEQTNEHRT